VNYIHELQITLSKIDPSPLVPFVKGCHGTLWIAGNGGSASTAQHWACDLSKAAGVRAQALGCNTAVNTAWANDEDYGVALARRFYNNKPPTILDAPQHMAWAALNIADPETPVGARGIGEPPVAAGCCAVLNAIADAVGDDVFKRAPVMLGTLLAALEAGAPVQHPLTANI